MSTASTPGAAFPSPDGAARQGGVSISLDVPERVKDAYDRRVLDEWGRTATMASATLERELAAEFGEGPVTGLREEIDTLLETVGLPGREPTLGGADDAGGEKVTVRYHVSEHLADRLRAEAKRSDLRSAGDFLAALMWRYACGDGALDRAREALTRATEAAEEQIDPETGKMERVPRIIIEGLRQRADGDLDYFTVDDFETVIEETAALKFSASRHARETHLPSVLEELGFTWHPVNTGMFVDPDKFTIPETRDPRAKPTYLIDDGDRELAVRVAGYEAARESSRPFAKLHTADVVAGVESLSNAIAAEYMRKAADGAPGYRYDAGERVLKVNRREAEAAPENDDVLEIAGGAETGPAPETGETDGGEADEEPDPPDRGGDGDADTDEAAADADERMSELLDAEVRTDGGAVSEPPAGDVDGPASPPEPAPNADVDAGETDEVRLLTPICPTDGQMLSADAHRDGRRWECPRCRQRWTPDRVFPDL